MDKWDIMKIKNLGASKGTIKNVKRPPTEWEQVFSHLLSDKGLVLGIYM